MKLPRLPDVELQKIPHYARALGWGLSDPQRFFNLLDEAAKLAAPGIYIGDNLFTWGRNNSWAEDDVFRRSWEGNARNASDQIIAWRRYILACAGYHCVQLRGDFVECGVYAGSGVKTVMDYLGGPQFPRRFWAYDTYDYSPVDGEAFADQKEGFFGEVQARFLGYPNVKLVKGLLPDSLTGESPGEIAYLHLDLNNAASEIAVLEALFDRVVPGGITILDDYEWAMRYRPQKIAESKWFDDRNYRVFPLPTGQGIVIKR